MNDLFCDAYYAAAAAPRRLPPSEAEQRLKNVLAPGTLDVVSETVKRWNAPLRAEVRAVTALKLADNSGRSIANVPVAVIDGMPKPLAEVTSEIKEWQWWLVLQHRVLKNADEGLKLILENKYMLSEHLDDFATPFNAVSTTRAFISEIVALSINDDLLSRFKKIEDDVLGAYWIQASKIQIYWMPLAIFAPLLGVLVINLDNFYPLPRVSPCI